MAIFITVFIILLLLSIAFVLYACVVVGKESKSLEEIEYEKSEEIEYIKKCNEVKKQNKKNKFRDKKDKVIYL